MTDGCLILVVEDEPAVRRYLCLALASRGYRVTEAVNGAQALELADRCRPKVILLDYDLPQTDVLKLIRDLRRWPAAATLTLSVRTSEDDKVAALDAGADGYLSKPFGLEELLARIRSLVARLPSPSPEPVVGCGALRIDLGGRDVRRDGQRVKLTVTEYRILEVLLKARRTVTYRQLICEIWGDGQQRLHILQVFVSNLRKKIEPDPRSPVFLLTVPGVGYRFDLQDG